MWVIDNIFRGLFMMMRLSLFGYAIIHLFLTLKTLFRNRKK